MLAFSEDTIRISLARNAVYREPARNMRVCTSCSCHSVLQKHFYPSSSRGMISITLIAIAAVASATPTEGFKSRPGGHAFSPRMDYDEWRPLGRGDPLKNDPTYDYMPPVLDRVHYWVDPEKRTPDPPMPISSVITEPAPTLTPATSRLGTYTLLDPFFKLVDKTKNIIGIGLTNSLRPTTTALHYPPTHFTPSIHETIKTEAVDYMPPPPPPQPQQQKMQALQRPPYTMLMPPPPPIPQTLYSTSTQDPVTSFGTSTQTTELADQPPTTSERASTEEVVRTTTVHTPPPTILTTVIANAENLYKPVAITMPESISNETSEELNEVTTPTHVAFPMFTIYKDNNRLQDEEMKLMSPPADKYFGFLPTTVRTTTTTQTLTTDPMFKHYKQPSKPSKGPFYLIIQGHSKVKTYGASKNKLTPLSMNDLQYDAGKDDHYDDYSERKYRTGRKLRGKNEEVIHGHPTVELRASYQAQEGAAFQVSENAERKNENSGERETPSDAPARFATRRLLAQVTKTPDKLDPNQMGLESLIALNDDYNSEDVINLLLKQNEEGSGFGGFVSSLFGRSLTTTNDEI